VTLLVIVGTANHFWLDALVAAALLGIALAVVPSPARRAKATDKAMGGASAPPAGADGGRPADEPASGGARTGGKGLVGARR
jgi:hypothetical protein